MELDKETQEKIQEIQSYEHTLQNLLMQKQAFQFESNETGNAIEEVSKSKDEVFKIVGSVMIKTDSEKILKELKQKSEHLSIRLKSIEKQESELTKKIDELRDDVMKKIK
ncbi:MAG: prefoldin subunit beta [Candidatus Nanoarchaeia archaeon]|nr:prefoldin subunit beta [Candidatus Nanoarchaeia archaeon]